MKPWLFGFLALVSVTAHAATDMPSKFWDQLKAGQKENVVLYGTSLTAGGAWAKDVGAWFEEKYPGQVTVFNTAGPGQNSDWGLANLEGHVLAHQPGLVFLEFSYNDAHEKFNLSVEKAYENLVAMVDAIRKQNPDTLIVLQIMNVGWDAPNGNRSASVRPNLTAYADNYRRLAKELDLPLLDHSIAWQKLKDTNPAHFQAIVPDGSHPTVPGSREVTWPIVLKWLESNTVVPQ